MTQGIPGNSDFEISLPRSGSSDITPIPTDSATSPPTTLAESQITLTIRILSGALCLFLMAGFLLASNLDPSPRGYGTHQQLGLPPCSIQVLFGIPCPSCGMTTSFCWFVRGKILQSANANPAGLYLAIICALLIPWTLAVSLWNHILFTTNPQFWAVLLSCIYFLITIIQWGVRFFFAAY